MRCQYFRPCVPCVWLAAVFCGLGDFSTLWGANRPPPAPILIAPANGAIDVDPNRVVFTWNLDSDPDGDPIESYMVMRVRYESWEPHRPADLETASSYTATSLRSGVTYEWQVAAVDWAKRSSQWYTWSELRSFTTRAAQAAVLTVNGGPVTGEISGGGEADWYSFSVSATDTYTIETRLGTLADTVITLYGPNDRSRFITEDDDGGDGLASKITRSLTAGTYYVAVRAYNSSQTGTYDIRTFTTRTAEPVTLPLTINGNPMAAEIGVGGEVDWFSFIVSSSDTYTIETALGGLADSVIFLYGPNNRDSLITDDDDGGEGLASKIIRQLSPATYYVAVRAYRSSQRGTYQIWARTAPPPAALVIDGPTLNGEIHTSGEVDWFSFRTTVAGYYVIETQAASGRLGTDTVIHLYGPDNDTAEIAFDDDSGAGLFSSIKKYLEANRTYYVKVSGYGGSTTGAYVILVRKDTDPTLIFDLVISFEYSPTAARLDEFEPGIRTAANFLWASSGQQARLGKVDVYRNGSHRANADILVKNNPLRAEDNWDVSGWPPRFSVIRLGTMEDGGFSVYVADDEKTGSPLFSSSAWNGLRCYRTIVHEFGHYKFRQYDEYFGPVFNFFKLGFGRQDGECPDSGLPCIMDSPFANSVGFCVPTNHDSNRNTAQSKLNAGKSCFETMKERFPAFLIPGQGLEVAPTDPAANRGVGPLVQYEAH